LWAFKLYRAILTQKCVGFVVQLRILFGRRLKQIREERGLTQEQLSVIAGCSPQHISDVERGKYGMHFDRIDAIADYFGIPADAFFDFSKLSKD
jgi:transcriptional regulator with XRE-family HTH domain